MIRVLLPMRALSASRTVSSKQEPQQDILCSAKRYLPLDHLDQEGVVKLRQQVEDSTGTGNSLMKYGLVGAKPSDSLGDGDLDPIKDNITASNSRPDPPLTSHALDEGIVSSVTTNIFISNLFANTCVLTSDCSEVKLYSVGSYVHVSGVWMAHVTTHVNTSCPQVGGWMLMMM